MLLRWTLATLLLLFAALPASALELHTDKDVYAPGEDIQISAFNDSSRLVSFGSSAPYYARNVDTGQIVHFVGLAVMIYLDAVLIALTEVLGIAHERFGE